jgi:predicted secreted protein
MTGRPTLRRTMLCVCLPLALLSCSANVPHHMQAAQTITQDQDGREIALHVGERVAVCLNETPGTGYRWALEANPAKLSIVDSRYSASSSTPGSGGQQCFTLQADQPGDETVRFKLGRSWEGDASIVKRFGFKVSIASS